MPQPVTYRGMSLIVPDNDSEWNEYFALARQHTLMVRACSAMTVLLVLAAGAVIASPVHYSPMRDVPIPAVSSP